jgi:cytoskeleton protein RodZ
VREDSWIEIKDANDRTLISRLMAAGTTETLSVAKPVFLTVGNAAGVDVTLRGKSVDLQSAAKSNVARLNLK